MILNIIQMQCNLNIHHYQQVEKTHFFLVNQLSHYSHILFHITQETLFFIQLIFRNLCMCN